MRINLFYTNICRIHYPTVFCIVIILLRSCIVSRTFQILHNIINTEVQFSSVEPDCHWHVWMRASDMCLYDNTYSQRATQFSKAEAQKCQNSAAQPSQMSGLATAADCCSRETMGLVCPAADGISQWPNCPTGTRSPRENCSSNYYTIHMEERTWGS